MALKSKQQIIDTLTTSAQNMRKVREAAQRSKIINANSEPGVIPTAQTPLQPGAIINGKNKG